MKEIKIEHLAYLLKQARDTKQPQPIFFLGAGASRSGNIPLAGEIIKQILSDFSDSPFIKALPKEERTYAELMNCLLPDQRDALLKKYIEEAKINVTHIYLARLLKEGFVDYVLTVNFDNLMLRALALFNIFPSTYDMAILKDFTTSTFKEKSIVYLHGQSHGLWLLNTLEEMEKVKNTVPRIFDTIKNKRPWVFLGYSGEDPIFEHVKNLGRFDNGLFWVTYNDNNPNETVQKFIYETNTNTFIIKGYDSDSFMLKLNSELGLGQPSIVDKPFSALKEMLNEIVDIDDKEFFKGVKERLNISKRQVEEAILQFELGQVESSKNVEEKKVDLLKKEIINLLITEKYDKKVISDIEKRAKGIPDHNLQDLLAGLYSNWGASLGDLAKTKEGKKAEDLYRQSIEKIQKAIEIKPDYYEAYYNWGNSLGDLAKTKEGKEAEELYRQTFEKYKKAIEIKQDDQEVYYNWGTSLGDLAKTKEGKEAEKLFLQSFEKYKKAVEIKPDDHQAYYNWGTSLGDFANTKKGKEAEEIYMQTFEKFQKAVEIKLDYHKAYSNWGISLGNLAKTKESKEAEEIYMQSFQKYTKAIEIKPDNHQAYNSWGTSLGDFANTKKGKEAEEIYLQSFEKYQKAIEIKPNFHEAYYNWGITLGGLAKTKEGKEAEKLYLQSFEKFQKAFELGGSCYNLACLYAIKENKQDALYYLNISLSKKEITVQFVEKDDDWKKFLQDMDFVNILNKHRKQNPKA